MKIPTNISDLCENPVKQLEKYRELGVKVLGYTCSYVPEELIISAGLQPYRISNVGANTSTLTPSFVCPFASATLENILKLGEFFSGFVLAHTCDPMWRLYDIAKKKVKKPVFLLRVPHDTGGEHSLNFFEKELLRFKKFLKESFDAKVEDDALADAIKVCNENRSLLKEVYMLNNGGKHGVNVLDRFQIVLASMWMPKKELNPQLKNLNLKSDKKGGVRLHINGTAIYDLNLIKLIEDSGGFVASDDLCTGSRYFWNNVEESQNSISALAYRYLKRTPCPSHGPLQQRLEYIDFMVKEFKARGLITFAERFCDPMLYDSVHVKDALAKEGIPTMLIDYENPTQEIGRIKTRIEAFIESIGGYK
ncbi:MAG: 2-hydroxyacyl-CoA dehydratase subunit D [Candidatus Bathycorpusculaceae bacterium]